jgi:hypothetical protein
MKTSDHGRESVLSKIGIGGVFSILWRYFREKALEQLKSVWFIIFYLIFFQIFFLDLPIIYSATISLGVLVIVIGLAFFMEGLRLGLMPLGETIGAILPRNSNLPAIVGFAFILGIGATFAEPAIAVLRKAGSGVEAEVAPLLYSLLNDFPGQLVSCVGVGVGIAVTIGVIRFFYGWSLKILIIPIILSLLSMTLFAFFHPILNPVIGLAWDCGAVTTGPVTVPLVLALGIGVCRIINDDNNPGAGFGIVTLASLFPILAVLLLSFYHYFSQDYYGAEHYKKGKTTFESASEIDLEISNKNASLKIPSLAFTEKEFQIYKETGLIPGGEGAFKTNYQGGELIFLEGKIIHRNMEIHLEKVDTRNKLETLLEEQAKKPWDPRIEFLKELKGSILTAFQAILPLCLFLFITLLALLREPLKRADEIAIGILFSIFGMALFGLGLSFGLIPLGTQVGSNLPVTFTNIMPWGIEGTAESLFKNPDHGKWVAILFAFFLGYGATLAEPALNALGETIEKTTIGVFKKKLLMHTVAFGVGIGIATGVAQVTFPSLSLTLLLVPPYLILLIITLISTEEFVNFAWDSAGVTTGPITVPLVLAMGLGVGSNVPGSIDGFGILALASVGPILSVLIVGLIVNRTSINLESNLNENEEF